MGESGGHLAGAVWVQNNCQSDKWVAVHVGTQISQGTYFLVFGVTESVCSGTHFCYAGNSFPHFSPAFLEFLQGGGKSSIPCVMEKNQGFR